MKKILLAGIFVFIFFEMIAQEMPAQKENKLTDKELGLRYLKKSRQFKVAGWSLLGGGVILTAVGINMATSDLFNPNTGGEAITYVGSFLSLASIPCFIAGAKNKGRAEILLRNENILLSEINKNISNFLALGLVYKL